MKLIYNVRCQHPHAPYHSIMTLDPRAAVSAYAFIAHAFGREHAVLTLESGEMKDDPDDIIPHEELWKASPEDFREEIQSVFAAAPKLAQVRERNEESLTWSIKRERSAAADIGIAGSTAKIEDEAEQNVRTHWASLSIF